MSDGDSIWVSIALFSQAFPSNYNGPANFWKNVLVIRTIPKATAAVAEMIISLNICNL